MNAQAQTTPDQAYLSDLESLRSRAREQIMKGAVTPSFPEADRQAITDIQTEARRARVPPGWIR